MILDFCVGEIHLAGRIMCSVPAAGSTTANSLNKLLLFHDKILTLISSSRNILDLINYLACSRLISFIINFSQVFHVASAITSLSSPSGLFSGKLFLASGMRLLCDTATLITQLYRWTHRFAFQCLTFFSVQASVSPKPETSSAHCCSVNAFTTISQPANIPACTLYNALFVDGEIFCIKSHWTTETVVLTASGKENSPSQNDRENVLCEKYEIRLQKCQKLSQAIGARKQIEIWHHIFPE